MSHHHVFVRIRFLYGNYTATLHAGVNVHWLKWCHSHFLWWIGQSIRLERYYVIVYLRFVQPQPHLTTSLSRCRLRHMGLSGDDIKNLHKLFKCCLWWCGCCWVYLGLHNCRNLQFSRPVLHISLTEVVCCIPPSRLHQFVKPHPLLPNALYLVLYCFGDCAHHPARLIIFAQPAKLCIFFIINLVFPILLIFGTWKIAQTVSDSILHLLKCSFRFCGCPSYLFNISHMFQLLHNCCLCVLNSLSCHCGRSIHIILDPFLLLFIA